MISELYVKMVSFSFSVHAVDAVTALVPQYFLTTTTTTTTTTIIIIIIIIIIIKEEEVEEEKEEEQKKKRIFRAPFHVKHAKLR